MPSRLIKLRIDAVDIASIFTTYTVHYGVHSDQGGLQLMIVNDLWFP